MQLSIEESRDQFFTLSREMIGHVRRLDQFRALFCEPVEDGCLKQEYEEAMNDTRGVEEGLTALVPNVEEVNVKFANNDVSSAAAENAVTKELLPSYEYQLPSATTARQATKLVTALLQTYKSFAEEITSTKRELAATTEAAAAAAAALADLELTGAPPGGTLEPFLNSVRLAEKARAKTEARLACYVSARAQAVNESKQVIADYLNGVVLKVVLGKRKIGEDEDEAADEGDEAAEAEAVAEAEAAAETPTAKKKTSASKVKSSRCRRSSSLLTWLTGTSYSQKFIVKHVWTVADIRSPEELYADFPALCKKIKAVDGAFYFQKAAVDLWPFTPENVRASTRERLGFVGGYANWADKIVAIKAREAALPRRNVPYKVVRQPREGEDPMTWALVGGEWWQENDGDKLFETAVLTRLSEMGTPNTTLLFESGNPENGLALVNYPASHDSAPYLRIVATLQADPFPIFYLELQTRNGAAASTDAA